MSASAPPLMSASLKAFASDLRSYEADVLKRVPTGARKFSRAHTYWLLSSLNGLGNTNRPDWAWSRMASSAGSAGIDIVGDALPPAAGLVSHAGGCGVGGTADSVPGSGCVGAPGIVLFPAPTPAPTSTGAGVGGMAGILPGGGADMPGAGAGLYAE